VAKNLSKTGRSAPPNPQAEVIQNGEAVTVVQPEGSITESTKIYPEPPFLLFHHPFRWVQDAEGRLMPSLKRLPIEPGTNGVDARGDYTVAVAAQVKRGWRLIPERECRATDTPDSRPGYVRRRRVARGYVHFYPWERIQMIGGREVVRCFDREGHRAWLDALVERGIIDPPNELVIDQLRARCNASLDQRSGDDSRGASRAVKLATKQLAALDAYGEGARV
jgi:hypothetical protein